MFMVEWGFQGHGNPAPISSSDSRKEKEERKCRRGLNAHCLLPKQNFSLSLSVSLFLSLDGGEFCMNLAHRAVAVAAAVAVARRNQEVGGSGILSRSRMLAPQEEPNLMMIWLSNLTQRS